jgi:hypothetical protein
MTDSVDEINNNTLEKVQDSSGMAQDECKITDFNNRRENN